MADEALKADIQIELDNLARLTREMDEVIKSILTTPDFIQTRAMGSILHDFYGGVEKIFKRIMIHIDGEQQEGENWHTELLMRMAQPLEGIRKAVISQELLEKLKAYLRFRHLFRHRYGFELQWKRFKDLSLSLNDILQELKNHLEKFLRDM